MTGCAFCQNLRAHDVCSQCKAVLYCDRECQTSHWPSHKATCVASSADVSERVWALSIGNDVEDVQWRCFPDSSFVREHFPAVDSVANGDSKTSMLMRKLSENTDGKFNVLASDFLRKVVVKQEVATLSSMVILFFPHNMPANDKTLSAARIWSKLLDQPLYTKQLINEIVKLSTTYECSTCSANVGTRIFHNKGDGDD
jgi:hypothetical protein